MLIQLGLTCDPFENYQKSYLLRTHETCAQPLPRMSRMQRELHRLSLFFQPVLFRTGCHNGYKGHIGCYNEQLGRVWIVQNWNRKGGFLNESGIKPMAQKINRDKSTLLSKDPASFLRQIKVALFKKTNCQLSGQGKLLRYCRFLAPEQCSQSGHLNRKTFGQAQPQNGGFPL